MLEIGRTYISRGGNYVATVVEISHIANDPHPVIVQLRSLENSMMFKESYMLDGSYMMARESQLDLVAEMELLNA